VTDPRGIRNNNPLNVEHNERNLWRGLAEPPSDGRFARFTEPQWGLRAAILILRKYNSRGITSLRGLISTWAPSHENNVESYIGAVVRCTGWTPATQPNLQDRADTIALLKAMCLVECGPAPAGTANGNWLDDAVYEAAWSLAKPLTQSRTTRGSVAAIASATAGAVLEAATDILPQATDAATMVTPIWPEVARWVLIVVVIAGAGLALYSRLQARNFGVR
jgi:hypothetical protein